MGISTLISVSGMNEIAADSIDMISLIAFKYKKT